MLRGEVVRLLTKIEKFKIHLNFPSALHVAALHGHEDVVDYLIREEVTFIEDALGLTPLDYAKKGKNPAIIKKLEGMTLTSNGYHSDEEN